MRISDWSSDVCSSDLADARIVQCRAGCEVLLGAGADGNRLEACNGLGDSGERGLRGRAVVTPVVRALRPDHPGLAVRRSEERRVGKECVSTCRSRWCPNPQKTQYTYPQLIIPT